MTDDPFATRPDGTKPQVCIFCSAERFLAETCGPCPGLRTVIETGIGLGRFAVSRQVLRSQLEIAVQPIGAKVVPKDEVALKRASEGGQPAQPGQVWRSAQCAKAFRSHWSQSRDLDCRLWRLHSSNKAQYHRRRRRLAMLPTQRIEPLWLASGAHPFAWPSCLGTQISCCCSCFGAAWTRTSL